MVSLSNGLTALLISDLAKQGQGDEQDGATETDSECRTSDDGEPGEDGEMPMEVRSAPTDCTIPCTDATAVNSGALEDGPVPSLDGGVVEEEEEEDDEEDLEEGGDDAESGDDEGRSARKAQAKQPKLVFLYAKEAQNKRATWLALNA